MWKVAETHEELIEEECSDEKIDFLVHVGAGKTGTSSIQQTLASNASELEIQNTKYLGLMLEYAFERYYDWQYSSKIQTYYALGHKIANKQLLNILTETIAEAKSSGITKIIWSNESLLGREQFFVEAFAVIAENVDINIKIIVYVRNYPEWTQSAYKQWGIKHKTYEGPVKKYSDWEGHHIPYFHKMIEPLCQKFPNSVVVRNMDAVENVVDDFCDICGIDTSNFSFVRANDSPGYEELYLRSIYNSQFKKKVLPDRYDKTIGKLTQLGQRADAVFLDMFPKKSELEKINEITSDDQKQINSLLEKQGQPLLDNTLPKKLNCERVDLGKLVNGLSELVIKQSIKIEHLEKDILLLRQVRNSWLRRIKRIFN